MKGIKCIDYCTQNFHGLSWHQGEYPYSSLFPAISHFADDTTLYAKGEQKCRWLHKYTTSQVIDLEQLGCPPTKQLPHASLCPHHNTFIKTCALDKAVRLGKYLSQLYEMTPLITTTTQEPCTSPAEI